MHSSRTWCDRFSRGQYRVAESHKQYEVTATAWLNKTPQERERRFKRFKGYIPMDKRVISSTDGMMNARESGKKSNLLGNWKNRARVHVSRNLSCVTFVGFFFKLLSVLYICFYCQTCYFLLSCSSYLACFVYRMCFYSKGRCTKLI